MAKSFETSRLLFRPVTLESLTELQRFHTDPEVMRFIGTGQLLSKNQSGEVLTRYLDQEKDHPALGAWTLYLRDEEVLVGSALLRVPMTNEPVPGLEIGYMLFEDYWGRGLGTEIARGIVTYGERETNERIFVAMVRPGNLGSESVLLKAGFVPAGKLPYSDPKTGLLVDLDFYRKSKEES